MKTSEYYMGPNCGIVAEDLIGWLDKIVYLISPNIRINLKVAKKGKDAIIQKKYINKNGLYDYAKLLAKKPSIDPLYFTESKKLIEHSRDTDIDRNIKLSFVFTFDSTNTEFVSDSFCNYVNTIDNGTHVDAVKQAIMQYLTKQTRDNLSERESKNIDILFNDVTQGLVLIVNIETDLNPQYTGQTKEKVSAPELFKPIRDMTYKTLILLLCLFSYSLCAYKCADELKLDTCYLESGSDTYVKACGKGKTCEQTEGGAYACVKRKNLLEEGDKCIVDEECQSGVCKDKKCTVLKDGDHAKSIMMKIVVMDHIARNLKTVMVHILVLNI